MNSLLAFLLDWPDLEMPIHKFLVVFVTAVQLLSPRVQSQVTFDQPCPKLDVVRDFDLHRVRHKLKSEPTDSVGPFWPPPDWFVAINLWRIVTNRLQIFDFDISSILASGTKLKVIRPSSARSPVVWRPTIPCWPMATSEWSTGVSTPGKNVTFFSYF